MKRKRGGEICLADTMGGVERMALEERIARTRAASVPSPGYAVLSHSGQDRDYLERIEEFYPLKRIKRAMQGVRGYLADRSIPPEKKTAVVLAYFGGIRNRDIGRRLGRCARTIYRWKKEGIKVIENKARCEPDMLEVTEREAYQGELRAEMEGGGVPGDVIEIVLERIASIRE
jgi:hypothetical protein